MEFAVYRFNCRLDSPALMPPFKGSTIRGALGRALKKEACVLDNDDCSGCLVAQRCLYPQVFEKKSTTAFYMGKPRSFPAPHPFVIGAPDSMQTSFSAGETIGFELILLGPVNAHYKYFIHAVKEMGRMGLGRRINGRRGGFVLDSVVWRNKLIYGAKTGQCVIPKPLDLKLAPLPPPGNTDRYDISLFLKTPLRTKQNNRLRDDLSFELLIRTALRRIASLSACYDGKEPDLDYRGLVQRAKRVEIMNNQLKWRDWRRYSSRQDGPMKLGGLVGRVSYRAVPVDFLPLLDFVTKVHLGKQTTFGLGKLEMTCSPCHKTAI